MLAHVASALARRAIQNSAAGHGIHRPDGGDTESYELPWWSILIFLADVILLLPVFVYLNYTLKHIYPTFAIIENENPPAYEPLSLDAVDETIIADQEAAAAGRSKPTSGRAETVTSSFRATHRLLLASGGGFRAIFRGLPCFFAQVFLTGIVLLLFGSALGGIFTPIASLLATLTMIQWSTAWVHIVISYPSKLPFWRRLPPFKRTFEATYKAVVLYWVATEFAIWIPYLLAFLLGLELPNISPSQPTTVPKFGTSDAWKSLVVLATFALSSIFIVIPAHVVLIRVQASLLPPEEDTVIPFDRSFEGRVEPALVGGTGFASIGQAWATFSKSAWRRLVMLYVKIFVVSGAAMALLALIFIPEFILVMKFSTPVGGDGN